MAVAVTTVNPVVVPAAATGTTALTAANFSSGLCIVTCGNTAAKAITLPAVATVPDGAILTVRKTTADAFALTITPDGAETIDGGATYALINDLGDSATFQMNGSEWILLEEDLSDTVVTMTATGTTTLTAAQFRGRSNTVFVRCPNTAAVTLITPAVATLPIGARFEVFKTTTDAFACTIDPPSSEQIDGGNTYAEIDAQYDRATFVSTGAAWLKRDFDIAA